MINHPPAEKPWLSWAYVAAWTLTIFMAIPLARAIQQFVRDTWGRESFMYAVATIIVAVLAVAVIWMIRFRPASVKACLWLAGVAATFLVYTLNVGQDQPEETVHFIQYGVLGVLVFRALSHRIRDSSVYLAAAVVCGIIGTADEFIQWLTPRRVWGLRDIWFNFSAGLLVQIGIAKGLAPKFIGSGMGRKNLQILCGLILTAVVLLSACLFITPPRIAWLANRFEALEFLNRNDSVMFEYGYRYEDPDIGIFRSRFAPEDLRHTDRVHAPEAAEILDRFKSREAYRFFLRYVTPMKDPFVHEARVHLFRRDYYYHTAWKHQDTPEEFKRRLTIAYRENQILEKYFTRTLRMSSYVWPRGKRSEARQHLLTDQVYESRVSQDLITRIDESQVTGFLAVLILGLVFLYVRLGKRSEEKLHDLSSIS